MTDLITAGKAAAQRHASQPTGAKMLDDIRDAIRRYCVLPGEHELVAVVLWVALTHLLSAFDYAPRLVIRSAEKRSGKSRLLEVIDALVYSPLRAVNATVAYIFRSLTADPPPTLLFDEADTIFGSKKVAENNEELRGLLNAGFQRGLPFGRTVGPTHVPQEFSTFAMAALALIGRAPETIEDRAVITIMKRRTADETVQPYRVGRDKAALTELHNRLTAWADEMRPRAGKEPTANMPVDDRAADLWEPLIAVADLAGGQWPRKAREAAKALVESAAEDDTARSVNLQLLEDIRSAFEGKFMKSADLCSKLRSITESPWEQFELNPSRLGRRLREYSIKTRHSDDKTERGYHLEDFDDAFSRYLQPPEKVSEGVQGVRQDVDLQKQQDTLGESKASRENRGGVPDTLSDTLEAEKASARKACSEAIPDTLDTFGHLPAEAGRPSPASMPQRRHLTAIPSERKPGDFRPPSGPGRCQSCGCHVPTQGHKPDCTANTEQETTTA